MSPRPAVVVLVVGTGTEVGKTWVAERLLRAWRAAGLAAAARKPAQSFAPGDATTDAERLGAASGEGAETVCAPHRWYPVPMAPPMAAEALGRVPSTLVDLVGEVIWPPLQADIGLVETAGGVRSPQAVDGGAAPGGWLVRRLARRPRTFDRGQTGGSPVFRPRSAQGW